MIYTAALCATLAQAAPDCVVLGTATPGGGFELYGRQFAEVLNEADPTLRIETRASGGSTENLRLLETGQLDIALVEGNVAQQMFISPSALRIVAATYPGPGMFAVRAESPYRSIADLKGRAVAFGTPASGLTRLAREVLDGLDLSAEKDFRAVFLDQAGEGPALLRSGKVDALWGGGIGWPVFAQAAAAPGGVRFIVPNGEEISRIRAKHPYLRPMTVPPGSYAGQDAPLESLGLWSFVLARPGFPEELAYRLARAVHRGETQLAARLAQGRYTTSANTAAEVPRRDLLHPGVARFLDEIGK